MPTVIVNGTRREVAEGTTLAAVVASVATSAAGVAVALNDQVVRRTEWTATVVADTDHIEILTAVQGG